MAAGRRCNEHAHSKTKSNASEGGKDAQERVCKASHPLRTDHVICGPLGKHIPRRARKYSRNSKHPCAHIFTAELNYSYRVQEMTDGTPGLREEGADSLGGCISSIRSVTHSNRVQEMTNQHLINTECKHSSCSIEGDIIFTLIKSIQFVMAKYHLV